MANIVFKNEQIYALSEELRISQSSIRIVLEKYIGRLLDRLDKGETVKFLNICYLVSNSNKGTSQETLAYVSSEIGNETRLGKNVVYRILSSYEDLIVRDVRKFYTYVVRGLVKIKLDEYINNVYAVRITKSSCLANKGIRVVSINSFKRKVEGYDR